MTNRLKSVLFLFALYLSNAYAESNFLIPHKDSLLMGVGTSVCNYVCEADKLRQQIQDLNIFINGANEKIRIKEEDLKAELLKIADLDSSLSAIKAENSALKSYTHSLTSQISEATNKVTTLQESHVNLLKEKTSLTEQIYGLTRKLTLTDKQVNDCSFGLSNCQSDNTKLIEKNQQYESENLSLKQDNAQLEGGIEKANAESNLLKGCLAKIKGESDCWKLRYELILCMYNPDCKNNSIGKKYECKVDFDECERFLSKK